MKVVELPNLSNKGLVCVLSFECYWIVRYDIMVKYFLTIWNALLKKSLLFNFLEMFCLIDVKLLLIWIQTVGAIHLTVRNKGTKLCFLLPLECDN